MKNVNLVTELANETLDKVTKATNETIKKASKATQKVADDIGEKEEQLRTLEQRLLKETKAYVQENPLASVGIAMGVGYLLSKWFSNDR